MIMELILATILSFGVGAYAGKEEGKKQASDDRRAPEVWKPVDHKDLLKVCGQMCGENNLQSYNVIYGTCKCKGE